MVSSGLPITLPSIPLPFSLALSSADADACGWMKTTAPSSSALAQNGWNAASDSSRPATLPPIAAPRNPNRLHALLELPRREIGKLQGDGGECREAIRVRRAERGHRLVLYRDDLRRELAIGARTNSG